MDSADSAGNDSGDDSNKDNTGNDDTDNDDTDSIRHPDTFQIVFRPFKILLWHFTW